MTKFDKVRYGIMKAVLSLIKGFILLLLFFILITPIALIIRIFGMDLLRLKSDGAAASYFIERKPSGSTRSSMKSQF